MKKYGKDAMTVFLTVNEKGETQNVFATVGMAIDAIAYDKCRIMPGTWYFFSKGYTLV